MTYINNHSIPILSFPLIPSLYGSFLAFFPCGHLCSYKKIFMTVLFGYWVLQQKEEAFYHHPMYVWSTNTMLGAMAIPTITTVLSGNQSFRLITNITNFNLRRCWCCRSPDHFWNVLQNILHLYSLLTTVLRHPLSEIIVATWWSLSKTLKGKKMGKVSKTFFY